MTPVNETRSFTCKNGGRFQSDFNLNSVSVLCKSDGNYEDVDWPRCVTGKPFLYCISNDIHTYVLH